MNYQITCVCGNRFFIPEQQLGQHVTCPACNRALIPVSAQPDAAVVSAAAAPDAGAGVPSGVEPTKRCPFCGEVILAIARKCKHCGEFLDRAAPPTGAAVAAVATAPVSAPGPEVPPVFELSVSQWDNFWKYLICLTMVVIVSAALLLIPPLKQYAPLGVSGTFVIMAFMAWFFYLSVHNSRCVIRPNRVETEVGIFAKQLDAVDMIRITDIELKQGLLQRLLGIGTVLIRSSDPSNPELMLYQVPQARKVYKYLQDQVPVAQKQRGMVMVDNK